MSSEKNEKFLDFWDFEAIRDPSKEVLKKSQFPVDREVPNKEMNFYFDKLYKRIEKFKDNKCYHLLEAYYINSKKVFESKKATDMAINYDNANTCLKLFTYCWELDKIENQNNIKDNTIIKTLI